MNIRHQILLLPVLVALIAGGLLAAGMLYIEGTTDRVIRERELGLAEELHLLRAFAIRDYQGEVAGIFTVAVPTAIHDSVTLTSRRISLLLAGVSVLIAAGLALLLGRRIVGQIAAISRATVDLASGNRDIAIAIPGHRAARRAGRHGAGAAGLCR